MVGVCCFLLPDSQMCIQGRGHDDNRHELKFGDGIREWGERVSRMQAHYLPEEAMTQFQDLANLCALLFEGSQRPITDRVEGRRRAALEACREFMEKYI